MCLGCVYLPRLRFPFTPYGFVHQVPFFPPAALRSVAPRCGVAGLTSTGLTVHASCLLAVGTCVVAVGSWWRCEHVAGKLEHTPR